MAQNTRGKEMLCIVAAMGIRQNRQQLQVMREFQVGSENVTKLSFSLLQRYSAFNPTNYLDK